MSLKNFHVVFIVVATLLFLVLGYWSYESYISYDSLNYLFLGLFSAVCFLGLITYEIWFIKKSKDVL